MKIVFNRLPNTHLSSSPLQDWLHTLCPLYKVVISHLTYNFISEQEMLNLNRDFLDHDTHTDIITFQYADSPIEGEVYISTQRMLENAKKYGQTLENELLRLVSHGFLHLVGYSDKANSQKVIMHKEENRCIELFHVKHRTNV